MTDRVRVLVLQQQRQASLLGRWPLVVSGQPAIAAIASEGRLG